MTLAEYKYIINSTPTPIKTLKELAEKYNVAKTGVVLCFNVRIPWKTYVLRVHNANKLLDSTPIPPTPRYSNYDNNYDNNYDID